MKDRLKFFGLSFFCDGVAKGAKKSGLINFFLSFLLALILIFCGTLGGNFAPFKSNYNAAADYKAFVNNAAENCALTVNGGKISADAVINTFENTADAEKFSSGGYNLIVDTRPYASYDDFTAYCVSKSDGGEIAYGDFLALGEEQRKNYNFKIRYTGVLLSVDERAQEYESYLSASADENIKKEYETLLSGKESAGATYNDKLYALYLKAYYAPVSAFKNGGAPLLRNYYYENYINKSETRKYLIVFDNLALSLFETDKGADASLYGGYGCMPSGEIKSGDALIYGVYSSFVNYGAMLYAVSVFRSIPVFAVVPLILAAVLKLFMVKMHSRELAPYLTCLKLVGAYMAFSALLTALGTIVLGFVIPSSALNVLPYILFAAVMALRTAVFILCEYLRNKKQKDVEKEEVADEL